MVFPSVKSLGHRVGHVGWRTSIWGTFALHRIIIYSKTQSSYVSISFMQGEVSRIGGTDAGVLPKYKNDIYKNIMIYQNWKFILFVFKTWIFFCIFKENNQQYFFWKFHPSLNTMR